MMHGYGRPLRCLKMKTNRVYTPTGVISNASEARQRQGVLCTCTGVSFGREGLSAKRGGGLAKHTTLSGRRVELPIFLRITPGFQCLQQQGTPAKQHQKPADQAAFCNTTCSCAYWSSPAGARCLRQYSLAAPTPLPGCTLMPQSSMAISAPAMPDIRWTSFMSPR
jgi:hypothetical protein